MKIIFFSAFFYIIHALPNESFCLQEPLCSCSQYMDMFNIDCANVTSLEKVMNLLNTQFADRAINELSFKEGCKLTSLPDFAFHGKSIRTFNATCPFSDIPSSTFNGTNWLAEVSLSGTAFPTLPEGLRYLRLLKILNLKNGNFSSLKGELWNLSSLVNLDFSYGILEELSTEAFSGNPNIQCMNLSYNNLGYVHPDTFKPLKFLQKLSLRVNHIFSVDGLFTNTNLQVIDLYGNELVSLDNAFPKDLWLMQELNIGKNPLRNINSSAFGFKFHQLKIWDMTDAGCSEIDEKLLHFFPSIERVRLRGNGIREIPKTFFRNLEFLRTIDLTDNNVSSVQGLFYNSPKIKSLFLALNNISEIGGSFHGLLELKRLNLSRNYIQYIDRNSFEGLVKLRFLDLSHNEIQLIDSKTFIGLPKLKLLDLSSNSFAQLNKSLQNLDSLKTLHLRSIGLKDIDRDEFDGLTKLSNLSLQDNRITSLNGVLEKLYRLNTLNLTNNKLRTLPRDTFPEDINLLGLSFAMNELECDCRLIWMVKWLAATNNLFLLDNPVCLSPARLQGKSLRDLTVKDLTEWTDGCPAPCRCECVSQRRNFHVRVDCSARNLTRIPRLLPEHLGYLDMSGNEVVEVGTFSGSSYRDLSILNLERNRILNIDIQSVPSDLKVLKLSGNLLNKLSWQEVRNDSLEVLTLSKNPWTCDCETIGFKKWLLSKDETITDVNETRCGADGPIPDLYGTVITSLKDNELCPSVVSLYVSISLALLGSMLLATSVVLVYSRYRLYIKVWLYAHGFTWVKEDDTDIDKLFDAVLSYHPLDEMFVLTAIAPGLEDMEPKFNLCIPERDIVSGVFTVVTTMRAVQDAKRIIIILDQDYMNDEFCMSIFRQAFQLSLEDKINRMIVIKVGDIPSSEVLDPDLKVTLESTRCIVWRERLFWEKLRYAMPKKTTTQNFEDSRTIYQMSYLESYLHK